jgi:uncharacterized protein (DUF2147 family)
MRGLTKKVIPVVVLLVSVLGTKLVNAQNDKIEGFWFNDKKDAKIQIFKARDGKFYGKIVWLKDPLKNGKPKTDEKNPKADLKSKPLVELVILRGFEVDGDTYDDGTIYDPENGKTYDCKMTYKGKTLAIRGYIGISLFGRTTTWERTGSEMIGGLK